ncbi:MAG: M14 family zinc carboxypeptidase, partial [Candidatus Hodarchaeota archaeon]
MKTKRNRMKKLIIPILLVLTIGLGGIMLINPSIKDDGGNGEIFGLPPDVEPGPSAPPVVDYTRYTTYSPIVTHMGNLATNFPGYCERIDITTLYGINPIPRTSGGSYDLYMLRLTNESTGFHKPEVLLQGGIHGDERTGPNNLIWFADWFLRYAVGGTTFPGGWGNSSYDGFESEYFQWLLNNREIYILPVFNPDGWDRNVRADYTGRDMNRNFDMDCAALSMATENANHMEVLMNNHQFRLGFDAHDGAHVMCYPADSIHSGATGTTIHPGYSGNHDGRLQYYAPPDYYYMDASLGIVQAFIGNTPDGAFGATSSNDYGLLPGGHWYEAQGCQDTFMTYANEPNEFGYMDYPGNYPGAGIYHFCCEYSATKNTPSDEFGDDSSAPGSCWVAGAKRQYLFLIDFAQPYVGWDKSQVPANHSQVQPGSTITLRYQVNGSLVCDETRIQWGTNSDPTTTWSYTTPNNMTWAGDWWGGTGWDDAYDGQTFGPWYEEQITLPTTPGDYYFTARAKVDQIYGTSASNPGGSHGYGDLSTRGNTYLRMVRERTWNGWSEDISGTDGTEHMEYQEYWYAPTLHVQVVADPVVNITTPVENGEVYGLYQIRMNATDPDANIADVRVQVNGGSWLAATQEGAGSDMWYLDHDFSVYPEGSIIINAYCTNDEGPAVTRYAPNRTAIVNNYLPPNVAITNLVNGSTQTAGGNLFVQWDAAGPRVTNIDSTRLYWTNGTVMTTTTYPFSANEDPPPIDFDTSGPNGYFNTTGNTYGPEAGNDGWDWQRDCGYVAASTLSIAGFRDPDGDSGGTPDSLHPDAIEVIICGTAAAGIDSGAFGLQFYVDVGLGLTGATLSFDWWGYDTEDWLGSDETEEYMYVKARFGSLGNMQFLQGTGPQGGDADADIAYWNSPNGGGVVHQSGSESIDVSSLITGTGWYYLELGAVFDARGGSMAASEGVAAFFDNINLVVQAQNLITDPFVPGHDNLWTTPTDQSGPAGMFNDTISLPNMPGTTIYLAANASSDGQGEESRSLIWEIDLIVGGVTISNEQVNPSSGGTGTSFTISADIGVSSGTLDVVEAYVTNATINETVSMSGPGGGGTFTGNWDSTGKSIDTYDIHIYAHSTSGDSADNTALSLQIVNTPPSIASASINPSPAYTNDTLNGVASGWYDADGHSEGYAYRWFKNSAELAGELTSTLDSSNFVRGDSIVVEITPYDGINYGTAVNSTPLVIQNLIPVASSLDLNPDPAYTSDDLIASYSYSDIDGDPEGATQIRWYRNSSVQSSYNDLTTLPSSATSKHDDWYFTVRPYDGTDYGNIQTSPTVTIENTVPTASGLDLNPDPAVTTDNLVASYTYDDADLDGEGTTEIRWYLNGSIQVAYNDLLILPSTATSKNDNWYFTVQPHDGTAFGNIQTSPTVTIQNSVPTASALDLNPDPAVTTDDLVASYTYDDADLDGEGATQIRWYLNGSLQVAYNNLLTLPSTATSKNDNWYFTVRPFDGTDYGNIQTSPTVTIENTAPTASGLDLNPDPAVTTDNLVASYTY